MVGLHACLMQAIQQLAAEARDAAATMVSSKTEQCIMGGGALINSEDGNFKDLCLIKMINYYLTSDHKILPLEAADDLQIISNLDKLTVVHVVYIY